MEEEQVGDTEVKGGEVCNGEYLNAEKRVFSSSLEQKRTAWKVGFELWLQGSEGTLRVSYGVDIWNERRLWFLSKTVKWKWSFSTTDASPPNTCIVALFTAGESKLRF
jgi:hypothetical protein